MLSIMYLLVANCKGGGGRIECERGMFYDQKGMGKIWLYLLYDWKL